jgi:TPR repeat protein
MGQNDYQLEDLTRARLLETARAMVLRGDSKFSVTSLCAEAGVERAQFRAQFSGKTALMAALMAQSAPPDPVTQPQAQAAVQTVPQPISEPVVEAPAPASQAVQPVSKAEKTSEPGVSTPDAWLERRLRVFERALNALEAKAENATREQARAIAQLQERLDGVPMPAPEAVPMSASAPALAPLPAPAPKPSAQPSETTVVAFLPAPKPVQENRVELAGMAQEKAPAAQEMQAQAAIQPELELPALPPAPLNVATKEEMADVLQTAREKVRAAVETEVEPQPPHKRTRWLAVAAVALAALFLCVGLSLGRNFLGNNADAHPKSDGVTQRHQASVPLAKTTALADAGNPRAQARLALAYLRGQGSAGDANAALLWAISAAKAGDPVAQYLLGALYQQGDHVKADPEQAFVWFGRAAEKGNLKAMHNLAIAYAHGYGTPKDDAKAVEWFTRAAERGYVDSAFDLAVFYERGIGARQDLKQSLKWYGVAAMAGDAPSKERAVSLRREMKPADVKLADAAAMAFAPLPALSDANNP